MTLAPQIRLRLFTKHTTRKAPDYKKERIDVTLSTLVSIIISIFFDTHCVPTVDFVLTILDIFLANSTATFHEIISCVFSIKRNVHIFYLLAVVWLSVGPFGWRRRNFCEKCGRSFARRKPHECTLVWRIKIYTVSENHTALYFWSDARYEGRLNKFSLAWCFYFVWAELSRRTLQLRAVFTLTSDNIISIIWMWIVFWKLNLMLHTLKKCIDWIVFMYIFQNE